MPVLVVFSSESRKHSLKEGVVRQHLVDVRIPRHRHAAVRSKPPRGGEEQTSNGDDEERHGAVNEARSLTEQHHEQKVRAIERSGRGQLGRSGRRAPDEGGNQRSSSEVLSSDARDGAHMMREAIRGPHQRSSDRTHGTART